MAEDSSGNLLVIILDISPGQELLREGKGVLVSCLDGIMAFSNSHLMMNSKNKLAVIACHSKTSSFLYPNPETKSKEGRQQDGKYELFSRVNNSIKQNIKKLILEDLKSEIHIESLLAGAMCMALCYINRIEKELIVGEKIASRILVITAASDCAAQYMNFMNAFFTAQKLNVMIDACLLDKDSGLLQQGCDITGGMYLKIPHISGFLQYLLWVFLPDANERKLMVLPPPSKVDFRAACFCHRYLIEIGYVCSVCLSIFCSFSPICSTCQTVFKFLGPPILKAKKKKSKHSTVTI